MPSAASLSFNSRGNHMRSSLRALIAGVLTLATLAVSATAASAVTVNPLAPIDAQGTVLQVINIPSIARTYTCRWRLQGQIVQNAIPLGDNLVVIGGIGAATILCNEPGVQIIPLVSPPSGGPRPWPIGLTPTRGVLGLPAPVGLLVEILLVRIRVVDGDFQCLFTGRMGLLLRNGFQPQAQLLSSQFVATPVEGDTCPAGLPLTKGPGIYAMFPLWVIGP